MRRTAPRPMLVRAAVSAPDPLAGFDPHGAANAAPSLTDAERADVMPTLNILDFDDHGQLIDDVFRQDERQAERRRENARRLGLAIEQYDATHRDTRLDHIFGEPEARSSGSAGKKVGTHDLTANEAELNALLFGKHSADG